MSTPRCPIHETVLNAAGDCLLCDHPELDPDGLTAEEAQAELDATPDRPLTPDEVADVDKTVVWVMARICGECRRDLRQAGHHPSCSRHPGNG